MKYIDINKRYTEIVTEYMAKGYTINTASMSGSQGEVAKIDLTDGNDIIRIRIATFSDWEADLDGFEIIVGKSTDNVKPNSNETFCTIWDSRLEVIHTERFYQISGSRRHDYYGTKEEAERASKVRRERYIQKCTESKKFEASPKAMEIAKRIVHRKMGYIRINASKVEIRKGKKGYIVSYNGKSCAVR